jgi:hypothetical protein
MFMNLASVDNPIRAITRAKLGKICGATTKYLHIYVESTEQCLESSELLTPTPSPPSEYVLPPHQRRGGTHSPGGEGGGVNIS